LRHHPRPGGTVLNFYLFKAMKNNKLSQFRSFIFRQYPTFFIFGIILLLFPLSVAAEAKYGTGYYTNLNGCGTYPVNANCHIGSYCNPSAGSCSGAADSVVKWICDGKFTNCEGLDKGEIWSAFQKIDGSNPGCGKTVQVDVFDKKCRVGCCGWKPPCPQSAPDCCTMLDYMVWYSGDCGTGTTCETINAYVDPNPVFSNSSITFTFTSNKGYTGVNLNPGGGAQSCSLQEATCSKINPKDSYSCWWRWTCTSTNSGSYTATFGNNENCSKSVSYNVSAPSGCPFGSVQTRIHKLDSDPWLTNITLYQNEGFSGAIFKNGAGVLTYDGRLKIWGPSFSQSYDNGANDDIYKNLFLPNVGNYTIRGEIIGHESQPGCSEEILINVISRPNPPTVDIKADDRNGMPSDGPVTIYYGTSPLLRWTSTNSTSCNAYGGWLGTRPVSGSENPGYIYQSTTYTIICNGQGGTATDSVTVNLEIAPPTVDLKVLYQGQLFDNVTILSGASISLTWTSNKANQCVASDDWLGTKPISSLGENMGSISSRKKYTITCSNEAGSAKDFVIVDIQKTLSVALEVIPNSGFHPLIGADLRATVSGTGTGAITYMFDCANDGVFEYTFNRIWDNPKTVVDACNYYSYYDLSKTYTARVRAFRDDAPPAEATAIVTVRRQESCNLSVSLQAIPNFGKSPLNGVDLKATVFGTESGTINYKFDCANDGTWDHVFNNVWELDNPKTVIDACNYANTGNYTARVYVERGSCSAESQTQVAVSCANCPTVDIKADGSDGPVNLEWYISSSINLSWTSTNVTSCTASGDWNGLKRTIGSEERNIVAGTTYTYRLTCQGLEGSSTDYVIVYVKSKPAPTFYINLTANPTSGTAPLNDVDLGAGVYGTAKGNINYQFDCTSDGVWDHIVNGVLAESFTIPDLCDYSSVGTYTARVCAQREGVSACATASINVSNPNAPTVTLKANNQEDHITISYNTAATLTWTSTNATSCTASNGWSGTRAINNTSPGENTGNLTSTKTYVLSCSGSGGTVIDSVTVEVFIPNGTLFVELEAIPNAGIAPLNDVDLRAIVTGTMTGPIHYSFDCTSDGRWDYDAPSYIDNSVSTFADGCDYSSPGSYTAKVEVIRGTAHAEDTAIIVVGCEHTPQAVITCEPPNCTVYTGEGLKLVNSSTDPNGKNTIASSEWDILGWGTKPDIRCNGTCDYTIQTQVLGAGTQRVELRVTDKEGYYDTETKDFTIVQDTTAGFECSLDNTNWKDCSGVNPIINKDTLYLKDEPFSEHSYASTGAMIVKRVWKINNSVIPSGINDTRISIVLTGRKDKIELTIYDNNGRSDSITHQISTTPPPVDYIEINPAEK